VINILRNQVRSLLQLYPSYLTRIEYEAQTFNRMNERPVELAFLFRQVSKHYPKTVLDVGSGNTALPHVLRNCGSLVTAIDNIRDYWPAGMSNRHWHVVDDDITDTRLTGTFDMVTCISVLEHVEKSDEAVSNMLKLVRDGGHLVLTCPYTDGGYIPDVYKLEGSSYGQDAAYVCQSYSRENLKRWFAGRGEILEQEYWQAWSGNYWTHGQQLIPPVQVEKHQPHQLTCLLVRKVRQ
jgi:2-polyprenyl-3-methyl-5-hydroxy-6-metoxy-1,4-benzoquinol methylase